MRWPKGSVSWWRAKAITVLGEGESARAALGLTRAEFAARVGVSPETARRWERDRQDPRPGVALLAAEGIVRRARSRVRAAARRHGLELVGPVPGARAPGGYALHRGGRPMGGPWGGAIDAEARRSLHGAALWVGVRRSGRRAGR